MDEIIIRRAAAEEWDEAMELAFKVFLKFEAKEYGEEGTEAFANFITDEMLRKLFLAGHYILYVAKRNGKIIGLISMRNGNHISLLFVDPLYHKMGIGRSLVEKLVEYLKTYTDQKLLTVNAAPSAIEFYRRLGFFETGELTRQDGIIYLPMELDYCY